MRCNFAVLCDLAVPCCANMLRHRRACIACRLFRTPRPWRYGSLYLPEGSKNLDNPEFALEPGSKVGGPIRQLGNRGCDAAGGSVCSALQRWRHARLAIDQACAGSHLLSHCRRRWLAR